MGSEMCIRDSACSSRAIRRPRPIQPDHRDPVCFGARGSHENRIGPVEEVQRDKLTSPFGLGADSIPDVCTPARSATRCPYSYVGVVAHAQLGAQPRARAARQRSTRPALAVKFDTHPSLGLCRDARRLYRTLQQTQRQLLTHARIACRSSMIPRGAQTRARFCVLAVPTVAAGGSRATPSGTVGLACPARVSDDSNVARVFDSGLSPPCNKFVIFGDFVSGR